MMHHAGHLEYKDKETLMQVGSNAGGAGPPQGTVQGTKTEGRGTQEL